MIEILDIKDAPEEEEEKEREQPEWREKHRNFKRKR